MKSSRLLLLASGFLCCSVGNPDVIDSIISRNAPDVLHRSKAAPMTCEANYTLSKIREFSKDKWLIRPEFHLPCMMLSVLIIILYALELRVVLRYRKSTPFTSTYFRVWTMQATADLSSLFCYLMFAFSRNIVRTWSFWMLLNLTSIPTFIIILNGAVIISQMTGVAMASVNRYLKLCLPTGQMTSKFDAMSTFQLGLIVLFIPTVVSTMILYNTSPVFVYTDGYSSVIAPCFRRSGTLVYAIVAPIWCITTLFISTLCYSKILTRLSSMSYLKRRDMKMERTLTMLSMPVFLSLWVVALYYCLIVMAIVVKWTQAYDMLFAYYHLINLILSVTNPLSALLSRDIRKRMFFQKVEFSNHRHTFLS